MNCLMMSFAADRMKAILPYRAQLSDVAERWYIATCIHHGYHHSIPHPEIKSY
jgi:hypothetical protein